MYSSSTAFEAVQREAGGQHLAAGRGGAHDVALAHQAAQDAALTILTERPDAPLACLPYRSADGSDRTADFPLYLSNPYYINGDPADRTVHGDMYDYTAACRYSMNNGWAAGTTPTEATVHAFNEIVERDAVSLLLIDQFLRSSPRQLRIVDPGTLPARLHSLHESAADRLGQPVQLLDVTTDVDIPAYWAYTPGPPGSPPQTRGSGASLSPSYAAERALTELIQSHSTFLDAGTAPEPDRAHTLAYPALHSCYMADLSARLPHAKLVPFTDAPRSRHATRTPDDAAGATHPARLPDVGAGAVREPTHRGGARHRARHGALPPRSGGAGRSSRRPGSGRPHSGLTDGPDPRRSAPPHERAASGDDFAKPPRRVETGPS